MIRFLLAAMALIAMCLADMAPQSAGMSLVSMAWADDDDDDGDDDDDDAPPRQAPRRPAPVRQRPAPPPPIYAPDEVIARGLSRADRDALRAQGFRELRSRNLSNGESLVRLRKPARMGLGPARDLVGQRPSARLAELNHYYRPANTGANARECQGAECPMRQMIDWPANTSGCGTPPRIGMVDTGLNAQHAALSAARLQLHRLDRDGRMAPSDKLHGTSVEALLVGDADSRTPGLVPQATLIAVDAFHKAGSDERADAYALIEALDYLAQQDVSVINLSLAGPYSKALAEQVTRLNKLGIVMVAAAGNGGPAAKPAFPAAHSVVIAVTAVDRRGQVYRRAARGTHIDLAAPGVEVWTAASVRGARTRTGTSYAAPFVTAAIALMLQENPDMTPAQIRARLQGSARDLGQAGPDEVFGHGLLLPVNPCGGARPAH